jgi:hypothetical protein
VTTAADATAPTAPTAPAANTNVDNTNVDAITGVRRRSLTLAEAGREFWRHPSPWIISAALLAAGTARALTSGWTWVDALVPVLIVASFPFVEWILHVTVLHFRPRQVGPVTLDMYAAKKHREHHADPRDIPLVFIPARVLLGLLGIYTLAVFYVFPRVSMGLTFLTSMAAMGMLYEWTHYLVHTDYRPKTAAYRAVWRHHRLHHYKNENYWFTVTTAHTSDRIFRTDPDPSTVPTSPTALNLHAMNDA